MYVYGINYSLTNQIFIFYAIHLSDINCHGLLHTITIINNLYIYVYIYIYIYIYILYIYTIKIVQLATLSKFACQLCHTLNAIQSKFLQGAFWLSQRDTCIGTTGTILTAFDLGIQAVSFILFLYHYLLQYIYFLYVCIKYHVQHTFNFVHMY